MPIYTFRDRTTGAETTESMRIAEMEERLANDPNLEVVLSPTAYGDAWRLRVTKPSDGFRDVLRDIKRRNPGSTIDV